MKLSALVLSMLATGFSVSALAQKSTFYRGKTDSQSVRTYRVEPSKSFVTLEPVFGYSSSTFSGIEGKNSTKIESSGDITGGLGLLFGSGDLQFDSGLFYASRGAAFQNMFNGTASADFKNRYLDIPALARYSFLSDSSYRVFVRGGVLLGVLLSSEVNAKNLADVRSGSGDAYFEKTDFRLAVGIGGTISISQNMALFISADYHEGLSKVNKDSFLKGFDVYNSSMMAMAGLSIGL